MSHVLVRNVDSIDLRLHPNEACNEDTNGLTGASQFVCISKMNNGKKTSSYSYNKELVKRLPQETFTEFGLKVPVFVQVEIFSGI